MADSLFCAARLYSVTHFVEDFSIFIVSPESVCSTVFICLFASRALTLLVEWQVGHLDLKILSVDDLSGALCVLEFHLSSAPRLLSLVAARSRMVLTFWYWLRVAEWLGCWTCNHQQVAGSNPSCHVVECNSGQVLNTHVPLSPSSIIWYQPMGGDALRLGR